MKTTLSTMIMCTSMSMLAAEYKRLATSYSEEENSTHVPPTAALRRRSIVTLKKTDGTTYMQTTPEGATTYISSIQARGILQIFQDPNADNINVRIPVTHEPSPLQKDSGALLAQAITFLGTKDENNQKLALYRIEVETLDRLLARLPLDKRRLIFVHTIVPPPEPDTLRPEKCCPCDCSIL